MPYYRISYDKYIEGEYENEDLAIADFTNHLDDRIEKVDLTIEVFNEKTEKWE